MNVLGTLQPAGTVTLGDVVEDVAVGVVAGVDEGLTELVEMLDAGVDEGFTELVEVLDAGFVDEELSFDELAVELGADAVEDKTQPRS